MTSMESVAETLERVASHLQVASLEFRAGTTESALDALERATAETRTAIEELTT